MTKHLFPVNYLTKRIEIKNKRKRREKIKIWKENEYSGH